MNELQRTLIDRLLNELRSLNATLLGVQEDIRAIRNQQETANQQQQEEKQQPHVLKADLQVPEAIQREKHTSEKRHFTVQAIIAGSTFLAFLAAAIYAGINYKMLRQMRESTKAALQAADAAQKALTQARKQFRQDQRPYIWLSDILKGPTLFVPPGSQVLEGGYVTWEWHYTNYGNSPAYDIHFDGTVLIGNHATSRGKHVFEPSQMAPPLPPGKDDFSTAIYNKRKVTIQEFQQLMSADGFIVVFGHFDYTDAFKDEKYETGFCFMHLRTGAVRWCPNPEENYIK